MKKVIFYDSAKVAGLKETYFSALGNAGRNSETVEKAEDSLIEVAAMLLDDEPKLQTWLRQAEGEERNALIELLLRMPTA